METLEHLTSDEKRAYLILLQEQDRRKRTRKIMSFYPDEGPLRRELYAPHMAFFENGAWARERAMIAANGVGKTLGVGLYETTLHLTGDYPHWWKGRRFNESIRAWAAGDTGQTVRDVLQYKLLGLPGDEGTGMLPGDKIAGFKKKAGNIPDAIESVMVKHSSGGMSMLVFKSYDQKRKAFQGTEQHVILLDEECPVSVYDECLMRTRTVGGMVLLTFTPLLGLTPVVLKFLVDGKMPAPGDDLVGSKFVVNATWADAPHLTEKEKEEILAGTLPHLRGARSKGIPTMGAGAIFPIPEEDLLITPNNEELEKMGFQKGTADRFEIPVWWPRAYAFDPGWNKTAALWGAIDPDTDVLYLYDEYYRGKVEPPSHAMAVMARGAWIPGAADVAGASMRDGTRIINEYLELGLDLLEADKAREAGFLNVWKRMTTGRLKVFPHLLNWLMEFRTIHRDENGKVVNEKDYHLMACTRYMVMTGVYIARTQPDEDEFDSGYRAHVNDGRCAVGGY